MRIDLNLAKDPFRNRSLFWLGMTAALLVALTAFLLVMTRAASVGASTAALREELQKQDETIQTLEGQIGQITDAKANAVFSDDDRRALDDARTLLNERSVSWSRLLSDLEPYVPAKAKITSISIEGMTGTGADRVVTVIVTGNAMDFGQLSVFIANLDTTGGRFVAEPVSNGPDDQTQEFEFEMAVQYRPELGAVAAPAPEQEKGDA